MPTALPPSPFPTLPLYRWVWLVVWLLTGSGEASAQGIQWASKVVGYSSEGHGEGAGQQFQASQILGIPSIYPRTGVSPCAWSPISVDGAPDEWITIAVANTRPVKQVIIAETANPGAIVRVILTDTYGKEHVIFSEKDAAIRANKTPIDPLLRVDVSDSTLEGRQVKVVLNPSRTKGVNQIDAIGLSYLPNPGVPGIRVSPDTPASLAKESIGRNVNTPGQEVAPVISPDGKVLYLTRNNHKGNTGLPGKQDVWYSVLGADRTWGEAQNIGPPINTNDNNAISGISPDGKTIYLINVYRPDGSMSFGISKSTMTKTGWSMPRECKIVNNYNKHKDNQLEFTVSPDGKTMLLAVQRNDALGDRDLYVSFRQPDLTWSEPKTLGPMVNTADSESSPFLAVDNKTLYFTSLGRPGFGNGDIYVTRRQDDSWTNWSEPENLGPAVNTPEWDGYFTIPASGDYAYLSSRANSLGEDDIFRLKLYPAIRPEPVAIISGQVLDAISKKPVATEVVSDLFDSSKEFAKVEYDPETGEYKMVLPTQKAYQLTARKDGYFPASETLDLSNDKRFRDIKRNLYLMPIQAGAKMILRGVRFAQSEASLLPGSEVELDRVFDLMTQHPDMTILLEGHTDNQGELGPNMKLAEDRVKTVKGYLTAKGITENRVQTKAWGPSRPIASNETEEKRKLNRRVEFTILTL